MKNFDIYILNIKIFLNILYYKKFSRIKNLFITFSFVLKFIFILRILIIEIYITVLIKTLAGTILKVF